MSKEEENKYFTRQLDKSRNPNQDFPPFVAKTKKDDAVYPLCTPYDATDTVQGSVWLTDDVENSGRNAKNGMTAATPEGVKNFTKEFTEKHSFYLSTEEDVENDPDAGNGASPSNLEEGTSPYVKAFSGKSVTNWELDGTGTPPPVVFTPDAPEFSFKNQVYFGKTGNKLEDDNSNRPIFYGGLTLDPAPTITVATGRDTNGNDTYAEADFTGNKNVDLTLPYISDDEIAELFNNTVDNDHIIVTTVISSGTGEPPSEGAAGSVYIKYSE